MEKVDAYQNTAADYDEIPDMADVDPSLVTWRIGDRVVSEVEARAARAAGRHGAPIPADDVRERVALDIDGDVVAAFRATGPNRRDRMNEALRKAVGL